MNEVIDRLISALESAVETDGVMFKRVPTTDSPSGEFSCCVIPNCVGEKNAIRFIGNTLKDGEHNISVSLCEVSRDGSFVSPIFNIGTISDEETIDRVD